MIYEYMFKEVVGSNFLVAVFWPVYSQALLFVSKKGEISKGSFTITQETMCNTLACIYIVMVCESKDCD